MQGYGKITLHAPISPYVLVTYTSACVNGTRMFNVPFLSLSNFIFPVHPSMAQFRDSLLYDLSQGASGSEPSQDRRRTGSSEEEDEDDLDNTDNSEPALKRLQDQDDDSDDAFQDAFPGINLKKRQWRLANGAEINLRRVRGFEQTSFLQQKR